MTIPHAWKHDWSVGLRLWIERNGQAILGKGRVELLEGIDRWHSISEAARQMGMSYRRAWLLIQSINSAAGEPLVTSATGGTHGGGARLTPQGVEAVAVFRQLQQQLHQAAAGLLPRLVKAPEESVLHVAASVSLEEVLSQLLTDYALRQPTVRVRTVLGPANELAEHLLAGAPADLFITADEQLLDQLEVAQLVRRGARYPLAENRLAALARADCLLRVRKPADLRELAVGRIALAEPASPLGGYTRTYLEGLRLYKAICARALLLDSSRAVVKAVLADQADVGLVYASDAVRAPGCRLLFEVRRSPVAIQYTAAVVQRGEPREQAQLLLDFLSSPGAAPVFRRHGFMPIRTDR